jgi:hypothetical protein
MTTLNRDTLIKASQKTKKIELEDGDIYIKLLNANQIFQLQNKNKDEAPSESMLFELASICVCDKSGNTFMSPEDISLLDMETINKIIIAIYEFNGLNPDAVAKAKEVLKSTESPNALT